MKEAYRRTRRESAPGVDGQTMEEYGKELESNLQELIGLAKSGRYHAPPVRRVHIPKGDGKETRPIGIPTCEDKVLQRAITMLLEAIYEQEFMESSFGFRPGRSAHGALEYLWKQCMDNQVRPEPTSDQNPTDSICSTLPVAGGQQEEGGTRERHLRLSGLHPLLGEDTKRRVCGETQDGRQAAEPEPQSDQPTNGCRAICIWKSGNSGTS